MTIVSKVRELAVKLVVVVGEDALSVEAQRNATILFMSLLRSTLNSKRALAEFKLNAEAFDWLIGEIETRFNALSTLTPCFSSTVARSIRQGRFNVTKPILLDGASHHVLRRVRGGGRGHST